jgi:hypothetical protein
VHESSEAGIPAGMETWLGETAMSRSTIEIGVPNGPWPIRGDSSGWQDSSPGSKSCLFRSLEFGSP